MRCEGGLPTHQCEVRSGSDTLLGPSAPDFYFSLEPEKGVLWPITRNMVEGASKHSEIFLALTQQAS